MKEYFYLIGKDQKGPFSFEEIVAKGITEDTLIWCDGMDNWEKLKNIPELKQVLKTVPPPPPKDSEEEKLKIELNDDLFLNPNKFDEITDDVSFTGLIYGEKSVESYLYILNNKSISIDRDLPIPGLSFTFASCNDKISFFLINEKTFKIFKLLDVERENIEEFKVENNQKYNSTLYKSSSGISATGVGTVLGTAVPIIGPIIGGLFGYGVSKLKAKINENSHKTIEKTGTIFHLICNRGNNEFTISIACESLRAKSFEQLLEKHWSVNNPLIQNK